MIAYNQQWLDSIQVQSALGQALDDGLIQPAEKEAGFAQFSTRFYTPNFIIRIGMFVLTVIISVFSLGLLALVILSLGDSSENTFIGLCISFGLACYGALEFMIQSKYHYRSGVDDSLMWMSGILLMSGVNFSGNISLLNNSLAIFIISAFFSARFADRLAAALATLAFLALVFFLLGNLGVTAKAITPFVLMTLSAGIYFITKKIAAKNLLRHYRECFTWIEITSLVCFYAAGNYFVVREASVQFFDLKLNPGENIPFAWIFWIFTTTIPLIYIVAGIVKKDSILLRTGLLLIAVLVFTVRNYYHVLPVETAMILGGIIMIAVAYFLIQLLRISKAGFTSQAMAKGADNGLKNMEALIIAETFSGSTDQPDEAGMGGGSFGGGGSSGDF